MEKIKILLADDHQIVLDGIQAFLEKEKEIQVMAYAKNGEEVLEYLNDHKVDIAVLDLRMPKKDGLETAKHILKNHPATKVILLTMHGEGDFIFQALKMGIHGFVLKEKSKETLVGAIHGVYRGSNFYSPDLYERLKDKKALEDDPEEEVHLTEREKEVLGLTGEALSAKEIATKLDINETTVNTHWRNLREKLKLPSVQALVRYAIQQGYTKI